MEQLSVLRRRTAYRGRQETQIQHRRGIPALVDLDRFDEMKPTLNTPGSWVRVGFGESEAR